MLHSVTGRSRLEQMDSTFIQEGLGIELDTTTILYSSGPIVVQFFGLSLMSFIAARMVRRTVRRVDDERTRRQLEFFAPKAVRVLVIAAGLEIAGIDITGMAAVLTTVGFTGAVIFTPLGQNMVAGVVTTLDDVFEVGDVIEVDDTYGKVASRSLLRTELRLPDGTTAWLPNSTLSDRVTLNHSRLGGYRIDVLVPLDGTPDRALATSIMQRTLAGIEWNVKNRDAFVCLDEIADASVIFRAYAWIDDRMMEPHYRSLLLTELVNALADEGFSLGHTTNLSMRSPDRVLPDA